MKRYGKLGLCLLSTLLILTACSGGEQSGGQIYAQSTQYLGPATATTAPTQEPQTNDDFYSEDGVSIFDNPYDLPQDDEFLPEDALSEENYDDGGEYTSYQDSLAAGGVSGDYVYAGASPIPLNPVDMEITPRPELSFEYGVYTAGSLGVSFEAPVGWTVDDSLTDVYTLTEPESQMHDGQQCIISISAEPVNNNYSESDLKKQVNQRLKAIGSVNFTEWDPSLTASRYLMGSKGVYANYTGTLASGVRVAGRILYASMDNRLYGIEMTFPREYREDYLNIFAKIRESMTR